MSSVHRIVQLNECKYESWHCRFVCVIKCNKRKKYPQITQESWALRQLGENYMRIHKPGWNRARSGHLYFTSAHGGITQSESCTVSLSGGGAKGRRRGGVCCKQWGCFMNANLTGLRLERHQHVNTPDRGGCTAIISKQPRPSQSTQAFYKC